VPAKVQEQPEPVGRRAHMISGMNGMSISFLLLVIATSQGNMMPFMHVSSQHQCSSSGQCTACVQLAPLLLKHAVVVGVLGHHHLLGACALRHELGVLLFPCLNLTALSWPTATMQRHSRPKLFTFYVDLQSGRF
jgi:hypothetical protein